MHGCQEVGLNTEFSLILDMLFEVLQTLSIKSTKKNCKKNILSLVKTCKSLFSAMLLAL